MSELALRQKIMNVVTTVELMHHVIHLSFDSAAEEEIRRTWRLLAEAGLLSSDQANFGTPHITLISSAPFLIAPLRPSFEQIAAELTPFEVMFSHVGIFLGSENVLFLGVTYTQQLSNLHERLFAAVSPVAEVLWFTKPDAAVFHCSLASGLRQQELGRALALLCDAPLPKKATVTHIEIVQCGTNVAPLQLRFGSGVAKPDS